MAKDAPGKVAGEINGDVAGTFVADLNAGRAVVDEDAGTIMFAFGSVLLDSENLVPDAEITNIQTTGKFKSILAVGSWNFFVNGIIKVQLIPDLPLQTNILSALADPDLLLGAEEEIVLTGSYSRSSKKK